MALVSCLKLTLNGTSQGFNIIARRNIGTSYVACAKATEVQDPIQKLFLDKLNDYKKKATKLQEGQLVDSTPDVEAKKKFGMDNLIRRYGAEDMTKFPKFSFEK